MEMTGQHRIEAPRERVWQALNDPEVLRASIPGCEELIRSGDNQFAAKVRAKIGPINARFNGEVTLSDIDPPKSYRIGGEGKGGAAGFAKGGARVRLEEDGAATILHYEVEASVGGKLAQLGVRLVDGVAHKMADEFFANFGRQVEGVAAGEAAAREEAMAEGTAEGAPPEALPAAQPAERPVMRPLTWLLLAAAIILLLLILFV